MNHARRIGVLGLGNARMGGRGVASLVVKIFKSREFLAAAEELEHVPGHSR
jgi:hypothetical protein